MRRDRLLVAVGFAWLAAAALAVAQSTVTTNPRITGEQGTATTFGSGGAASSTNGTLNSQVTVVSNTSIGAEDVLHTYTMPGNTLLNIGQGIRVTAGGIFAANANTKSARMYFGATLVANTSNIIAAPNGTAWRHTAECLRTSLTAQVCNTFTQSAGSSPWILTPTPAETLSGAVVVKVGGFSATAATDVTEKLFIVETIR